ncbi:M15 family metallopeptidase [Cellulomonas endophytica]|uniref:M15 family metallopeptidase n=1 Tax=Cellulomonas endophytica TaxID=2494735 RepID=UPI0010125208|nr:M15 family metallopeptidase [Cellulomonas endophytica]
MLDGISAIADRMAQIQQLVTSPAAPTSATASTSSVTTGRPSSATAFATALDEATSGATAATAWSSSVTRLGGGRVPAALAAYGNGKIPDSALEPVGSSGHRLWQPAAEGLENLLAAARADGVSIGITDSYRSYAAQVDVAQRKGLYSQGGLAATPGTSDHGWGMAVDLDLDASALAWMREHGGEHGFVADTPRESWHWSFQP